MTTSDNSYASPEERAAKIGQCLVHAVPSLAVIAAEIRSAEEAAQAAEREECALVAESEREPIGPMEPALYLASSMRPEIAVRAAITSTKASIAKRIRARGKEDRP